MAESKVRDDNYFQVSGWMLNHLNLKGVALQVFSIIYGFSQDGESCFTGSLQYLSDFTNSSKPTIIKAIKELVEKGYILKYENEMNGVKFNKYKANLLVVKNLNGGGKETLLGGSKESLPGGSKETLPNNKDTNNKSIIDKEIVKEVIELYHSICVSFPTIRAISKNREKAVLELLKTYSNDDFRVVFENAENSSFLKGKDGGWKASFDWLIKEANFLKVLEGNYADKGKRYGRREQIPGWIGQPEVGDAEMEAIKRLMSKPVTVGEDPELADRAEKLRQQLQG